MKREINIILGKRVGPSLSRLKIDRGVERLDRCSASFPYLFIYLVVYLSIYLFIIGRINQL